jgi:hypothetical protein
MSFLVPLMLFGWPLICVGFFGLFKPRIACLMSMLGAWLFLPMASYSIPGIPDYSKMSAASLGVAIGTVVFIPNRLFAFRPSLVDFPIAIVCISPLLSSISNGLGVYDGYSGSFTRFVTWGLPYLVGRLHFNSRTALQELAIGVFVAGLLYIPFCLFEIRMSPQLHTWVYGYHQHTFGQTKRLGGWRPTVFMQHGLMVGMWMCMTTLVGMGLWIGKAHKILFGYPIAYFVWINLITAILCKSTGAIILLAIGIIVYLGLKYMPTKLWLLILVSIAPVYMVSRISGWSGGGVVEVSDAITGRGNSLAFRMQNEDLLIERALQRPILGWGGWGRNRVFDENGRDLSITDGLWVIVLGQNGIVGLIAFSMLFTLPTIRLVRDANCERFLGKELANATALCVIILLYWIDCIPNGMVNPAFTMCVGALCATPVREPNSLAL